MTDPRTSTHIGSGTSDGDSWGGKALVLLLTSTLAHAVVARLVDGTRVVRGSDGRNSTVQDGQVSTLVSVAIFSIALAFAARALLATHEQRTRSVFAVSMQMLVVWWALLTILIPRTPGGLRPGDLVVIGAPVLVLAIVTDPPTARTVSMVNTIRDAFAAANLAYAALIPDLGQTACRDDKCGIFGTMYTGFFLQENTAPALISLLIPLSAAASTNRRVALSCGLALGIALTSGSRTGIATSMVGIVVAVLVRWRTRHGQLTLQVSDLVAAIPLGATLASLAIFLTADPDAFTGRGRIYAGIRESLTGMQAWYGIPWNTVLRATDGYIAADHGQAPHILARAGIIGLVLWFVAMVALLFYGRFTPLQLLGLVVLVSGSTTMLTESAFELETRSTGFFALMLATGLLASPEYSSVQTPDHPPRSSRQKATTASLVALTAAMVTAVVALSPPVYRATTTMSFSAAPDRPRQARDALAAAQVRAESFARLTQSRHVLEPALERNSLSMSIDEARHVVRVSRRELATVVTVSFDGRTPQEAQRVNDTIVNQTVSLAKRLEERPQDESQIYPTALGTSKTYRVSPFTENGTAIATILALGGVLTWNIWRQRPSRPGESPRTRLQVRRVRRFGEPYGRVVRVDRSPPS